MNRLRNIGDQVLVYDAKGNFECRGVIVGRSACNPPRYDVQAGREFSLGKRLCDIPEAQIRSVCKPFLAYERGPLPKPVHSMDEA